MKTRNDRNHGRGANRGFVMPDKILRFENRTEQTMGLLEFMGSMMKDAKRNDLKKWLKFGHLMVNGTVTSAFDTPVKPGDTVVLNLTRPFIVFKHPRLKLVYEDDDIIVVDKGYGLLSVDTDSAKKVDTAYSILRNYVKEVDPAQKIFIVHRLDRQTSGLMMFAKTIEAKETMQHNWNNMVLDRTYVALVEGIVEKDEGIIKSYLNETSQHEVYSVDEPEPGSKLAVTRYKVLKRGRNYTLVEFSLDTGRKNQIRVHSKLLGHPIAGDRKYGARTNPLNRLALHARTLRFVHPVTRKDMNFESPIPHGFVKS